MSRNPEYKFVETDSGALESKMITMYESLTNRTVQPSDPERLFIAWAASVIVQERTSQNYVGNQNLPSRAEGKNLDALGEWIYSVKRLAAQASKCTIRFFLTAPQESTVVIPYGTRITDTSKKMVWYTTQEAIVEIGKTDVEQTAQCTVTGEAGNGFVPGQINTLIDVDNIPYFSSCENIETSNGGADEATDEEYYELMRAGLSALSVAGPTSAYEYWAKSVSTNIVDVKVVQPVESISAEVKLFYTDDNKKVGFFGGDYLGVESLAIHPHGSEATAIRSVDYDVEYKNALLKITVKDNGILAEQSTIDLTVNKDKAGCVCIYALMKDGTIADSIIKESILKACSDDNVRPLTDVVTVEDAEVISYDIDVTYYIKHGSELSASDIQIAVKNAVDEFIVWQRSKIGRDINPTELNWRLRDTGIKRAVITSPTFISLRNGENHTIPQIASVRNVKITAGGYEDE